ncbi:MYG1 family protein [Haloferula rosea]|uniref:MYG1 family protein n=1 Tax=Haloferula rosea TaxID=490093 RepID=A0A934RB63_9BACT|nr:MYG1 family protein [Haloferula rosea]MBK1825761.1 MYG1 family protein [Haloferula rosea]
MSIHQILTHPGGAHKDEFLACCVLAAVHGCTIVRREPTQADLDDLSTAVVDVGGEHDPSRANFDHHQFPRDHEPVCALSLVLMDLGIYEDARSFCDWLETAERFDVTGPNSTAKWLGVERDALARLVSPIDITLLRRFAMVSQVKAGDPLYEVMRWVGEDLLEFIKSLRQRLAFVAEHAEVWEVDGLKVLFMPRTDPMPEEASAGLGRYIESLGLEKEVAGMVYPDRRGAGYGLSRFNDDARFDFTRIEGEEDVHFAHARGFVAKSSADQVERLKELLKIARVV